jgi:Ca-activated chloride channel family protein
VSEWTFAHRDWVHLAWVAVAIVIVLGVLELRTRDALGRFLSPEMQRRLATRPSNTYAITRIGLFGLALVFGVLALMRPQSGVHIERVGGAGFSSDVMVVLDVSRSMLADDVKPSRLARAKFEIKKIADGKELRGARMGLIAFAGRASLMCPLTPDRSFFDLVVDGVDTRSVSRGGTRIGDALRTAVKSFPPGPGSKLVVLITDGEDHDSFPLDAADVAKKAGVHVVAVGLGSEAGEPLSIPDPKTGASTPVMYDGQPVISKLDGETLRKIALDTEGVYVPAGTSALDLESIVKEHVRPIVRKDADAAVHVIAVEQYVWFVLASLLALIGAVWLGSIAGERT